MSRFAAVAFLLIALSVLACSSPKVTLFAMAQEESHITTLTRVYIMTAQDLGEGFLSGNERDDAPFNEMADQLTKQLRAKGYEVVGDRDNAAILVELSLYQFAPNVSAIGLAGQPPGIHAGKVVYPIKWMRMPHKAVLGMSVFRADQYLPPLQRARQILNAVRAGDEIPPETVPLWIGFLDASTRSLDLSRHIDEYVEILLSNFGENVGGKDFSIRPGPARKK